MRISDLLKMGLRNLRRRKARTTLTIVGVIIGTISIVVMVSLGIGLNYSYEKQMMEYGSINTLSIYQNGYVESEDGEYEQTDQKDLMNDDFVETLRQLDHVKSVTPVYSNSVTIYGNGWQTDSQLLSFDFSVLSEMSPPDPVLGSYDYTPGTDCVIIGGQAFYYRYKPGTGKEVTGDVDFSKEKLFFTFSSLAYQPDAAPSGEGEGTESTEYVEPKMITPKKELIKNFVTVNDPESYDFQYYICMDIKYFRQLYERQAKQMKSSERKRALKEIERFSEIRVIVDNAKNVSSVCEKIREYGAQPEGIGTYIDQVKEQAKVIELVLGGIGAVSMLVSAISIANTMIMSIYERTKEIGIMKVLGCVVTDIKKLFLLEAGTIGAIGGVLGIGLSYLLSYLLNHYGGPTIGASMGLPLEEDGTMSLSVIPIWLSLLALGFAFLVGVISGYFPARRATKISAIEAMKSEG